MVIYNWKGYKCVLTYYELASDAQSHKLVKNMKKYRFCLPNDYLCSYLTNWYASMRFDLFWGYGSFQGQRLVKNNLKIAKFLPTYRKSNLVFIYCAKISPLAIIDYNWNRYVCLGGVKWSTRSTNWPKSTKNSQSFLKPLKSNLVPAYSAETYPQWLLLTIDDGKVSYFACFGKYSDVTKSYFS